MNSLFYDEDEARRVGHPWMGDPTWGNDSYIAEFGQFVALFVLCCFAAGGMLIIAVASAPSIENYGVNCDSSSSARPRRNA